MRRIGLTAWLVPGLLLIGIGHAQAQQTTTYTYDALGRVTGVLQSGGPASGNAATYSYDPAGNRTSYTATLNAGISIAPASANEGSPLSFAVTRSGTTNNAVTVNYATSNGSAVAGTNYTASTGTLSFAAGVTTQTITVPTIDDHVYTGNLGMTVTLSSPSSGAVLNTASAAGTIANIDTQPVLSIAAASANEGSPLTFVVTRSVNTGSSVGVSYATSNGTALAGTNYTATNGTLTFAPGVTAQSITVPTLDDHVVTANLGMTVTLSTPTGGAALANPTGAGTIANIDAAGWSSTITSGIWSFCYTFCVYTVRGYDPSLSIGSMANTNYNGFNINELESSTLGFIVLGETGPSSPPNSGWTSITIPGVGTLQRSAATYSTSTTNGVYSAYWRWTSSAIVVSGTVTIQ